MMSRPDAEGTARFVQNVEHEPRFDDLVLSCQDKTPLIAEGDYDAIVLSCRKQQRFTRDLLAFQFRIVTQGAAFGVLLPGYCNLDFGRGRGRQLPARSKLAVWLRRINAFAPEVSHKRIRLKIFGTFQFLVHVATSRGIDEQHPLPTDEQYSQVTDILEVIGRITRRGTGI
jgi:hypothetical protein